MAKAGLAMSANPMVAFLQKPTEEFTKTDIIRFIKANEMKIVNFMYPADDGKLKTLNFVITNRDYLETMLTCGERVDGSSLFSFIEAGSSNLYVLPRSSTMFLDPFAEIPTLCMSCSYFNKDDNPLMSPPENTLCKAYHIFREIMGMEFYAMGELEHYVIDEDPEVFPAIGQHGYYESAPYAKMNDFHQQCTLYVAQTGGETKYGHSEVGIFTEGGLLYERNEIEFLPVYAEKAAGQLMLVKWAIRDLAYEMGLSMTFAPKITVDKAGSGLHIHMHMVKDGKNQMLDGGKLSAATREAIAGMMDLAESITAFDNKNPASCFRLMPHQEAPTNVCWDDCNRSMPVRVPFGWTVGIDPCHAANPQEPEVIADTSTKQTVEMCSPDGSTDLYQLIAGLCAACRHGFEMDNALEVADSTYVNVNIHDAANADKLSKLAQLSDSCCASADYLERQRTVYEEKGVFSKTMIDGIIKQLHPFNDRTLRHDIEKNHDTTKELVQEYFRCGQACNGKVDIQELGSCEAKETASAAQPPNS